MTEAEWLLCEDPLAPLAYVAPRATDRKLRLFLCACCSHVIEGTPSNRRLFRGSYAGSFQQLERALGVVEQFAEGLVGSDTLAQARRDAKDSEYVPGSIDYGGETGLDYEAATVVAAGAEHLVPGDVIAACRRASASQPDRSSEEQRIEDARWQSMLLRDVFGNPFRAINFSSDWRTASAIAVASEMYDAQDFGSMSILADALLDAGSDDADILDHCRGAHMHLRGCWVVDLVLGKD